AFPNWLWSRSKDLVDLSMGSNQVQFTYDFDRPDENIYLISGGKPSGINKPPKISEDLQVNMLNTLSIRADVISLSPFAKAAVCIMEYDDESRLKSTIYNLREGRNRFKLELTDRTKHMRIALRLAGKGSFKLAGLDVHGLQIQ